VSPKFAQKEILPVAVWDYSYIIIETFPALLKFSFYAKKILKSSKFCEKKAGFPKPPP